jgi:hypothetical protein
LRSFEEVDSIEESNVISEEEELMEQRQSEFAMKISNYANILLLALKVGISLFLVHSLEHLQVYYTIYILSFSSDICHS